MRTAAKIISAIECIGSILYGILINIALGSSPIIWVFFIVFSVVRFVLLGKREDWIDKNKKGLAGAITFFFIGSIGGILTWCIPSKEIYKNNKNVYKYNNNFNDTTSASSWKCKTCGSSQYGINFCTKCGTRRDDDSSSTKVNYNHSPMEPYFDNGSLICPLCAFSNIESSSRCSKCGLEFKLIVNNNKESNIDNLDDDSDDKFMEVKRYKNLLDEGIISEEEFNKKKSELLDI